MPVATPPQAAIDAFVADTSIVTRRIEIFEADAITPFKLDASLISGSVTVDATRDERRQFDCVLDNTDHSLNNYPDGFWYDKVIRLYRGVSYPDPSWIAPPFVSNNTDVTSISTPDVGPVTYGDETYGDGTYGGPDPVVVDPNTPTSAPYVTWEVPLGEFLIDEITSQNFPHTVTVKGRDRVKQLLEDEFNESTTFVANTNLVQVIRAIAANGGIVRMSTPVSAEKLISDFSFDNTTSRWKAITDLANASGYEVYFDAQGYMIMRLFRDPAQTPPVWSFLTGPSGNLVDFQKVANDTRLYNAVKVTGQTTNQIPVSYTAENNNPSDPTSIPRLKRRKVFDYPSSFINTVAGCKSLAQALLLVYGLDTFVTNLNAICLPWLEASDIVAFVDPNPNPGDPVDYLLSSFTIPLALGPMQLVVKRVVIIR